MDLNIYIGQVIKEAREHNNMTQEDLAERLDVTRQSISRYENGERKINQDILFELAEIFNISIDSFFPSQGKKFVIDHKLLENYNKLDESRKKKVAQYIQEQLFKQQSNKK